MTTPVPSLELLSALADGELSAGVFLRAVPEENASISLSNAVYSDWNSYQVIGQALRSGSTEGVTTGADPAFLQRLNARLAHETMHVSVPPMARQGVVAPPGQEAANASVFRWKLVAGFASMGAALVVAWSFTGAPGAATSSQLSQGAAAEQVVVASPQGPMVRDLKLEEQMAAHKQLGGSSLQAPSGFLRNAGFETSPSGRR